MREPAFSYYLITDRRACLPRPLEDVVDEACAHGVRAVQLREKDLPARALYELAMTIGNIVASHGGSLYINDRADIAIAAGAAGVHCPESSLGLASVKALNHGLKAGMSVHSVAAARQAEAEGVDFIVFGPVYYTASKAAYGEPQGIDRLAEVVAAVNTPVYAVGGVVPALADECLAVGAAGVAGISDVMTAGSVSRALVGWKEVLGEL